MEEYLWNYLEDNCTGKANAIKSKDLQKVMGVGGERLRGMVNQLRFAGVPICSGAVGYWYAENNDEVRETLQHMMGRVCGLNKAIGGLSDYLNR